MTEVDLFLKLLKRVKVSFEPFESDEDVQLLNYLFKFIVSYPTLFVMRKIYRDIHFNVFFSAVLLLCKKLTSIFEYHQQHHNHYRNK